MNIYVSCYLISDIWPFPHTGHPNRPYLPNRVHASPRNALPTMYFQISNNAEACQYIIPRVTRQLLTDNRIRRLSSQKPCDLLFTPCAQMKLLIKWKVARLASLQLNYRFLIRPNPLDRPTTAQYGRNIIITLAHMVRGTQNGLLTGLRVVRVRVCFPFFFLLFHHRGRGFP